MLLPTAESGFIFIRFTATQHASATWKQHKAAQGFHHEFVIVRAKGRGDKKRLLRL
jgi:hypothetical protein